MGWHRVQGYGASSKFEDGYVEIMPMAKLVKLYENRGEEKQKGTGLARFKSEIQWGNSKETIW